MHHLRVFHMAVLALALFATTATAGDWTGTVGAGTHYPFGIGVDGQAAYKNFHLRLFLGTTPGAYAKSGAKLAKSFGMLDDRASTLVQDLAPNAIYSEIGLGHTGWPFRGFGFELGFAVVSARNPTSTRNVLEIVLQQPVNIAGELPLRGTLGSTYLLTHYRWDFARRWAAIFRLGVQSISSATAELDLPPSLVVSAVNLQLSQFANTQLKGGSYPFFGATVVYRFGDVAPETTSSSAPIESAPQNP